MKRTELRPDNDLLRVANINEDRLQAWRVRYQQRGNVNVIKFLRHVPPEVA